MEKANIIAITSYFKGNEFLERVNSQGHNVYLITSHDLAEEPWSWSSVKEVFYMEAPEESVWNMNHLIQGLAHLMKSVRVDAVVALDDFDVEKAAYVRESLRIQGMGQTTQRFFRDKLAMRGKAQELGINVPAFTSIFNDNKVNQYADSIEAPWVLKPRSEASASGIVKVHNKEHLWEQIHGLGEQRHKYLLEQYKPGDVYHVDSIVSDGKIKFQYASRYLAPPMDVTKGGVFRTMTMDSKSEMANKLFKANKEVLTGFGLKLGASHTEFIVGHEDGKVYFLETASRVGGAYISDMVEAATGINLWAAWADAEIAHVLNKKYTCTPTRQDYAGLIVSLANVQHPDTGYISNPDLYRTMNKEYHVCLLFRNKEQKALLETLESETEEIVNRYSSHCDNS